MAVVGPGFVSEPGRAAHSVLAVGLGFATLLAGCLAAPSAPVGLDRLPTLLSFGSLQVGEGSPVYWSGIDGLDEIAFDANWPPGFWADREGGLVLMIDIPNATGMEGHGFEQFTMRLTLPDGSERAIGGCQGAQDVTERVQTGLRRMFLGEKEPTGCYIGSGVILVEDPPTGRYTIRVERNDGSDAYVAAVVVDARPPRKGSAVDLLPNLVTPAPTDLQVTGVETWINAPGAPGLPPPPPQTGIRGCDFREAMEHQARRCLRFANAVGNVGVGAFEYHLSLEEGASSFATGGSWTQRIFRTDGSHRDQIVGPAQFHAAHLHFHYLELTEYRLHEYDWEAQERGMQVGAGRKTGACFADQHLVALGLPYTSPSRYMTGNCLGWDARSLSGDWWSGLGSNWFDRYDWTYGDQYVEISGVPDGVYELVSTSNPGRTVIESDYDDNEGSVVFRLTGDTVTILDNRTAAPAAPAGVRI